MLHRRVAGRLAEGYSHYNIGQRPYEMAYKSVEVLKDYLENGTAPPPAVVTGLEVCTPDMADTCGKTN